VSETSPPEPILNVTSAPFNLINLTSAVINETRVLPTSNVTFDTSELRHGPIITATLDSGAMVRVSWLLKQGQNLSFTINSDTEGIVYTLDSPSRKLHKNLEVASPFSYRESGDEEGLYTLRLKNTGNLSNGVVTHVVPNASDAVLSSPVHLDQTLSQGLSSRALPNQSSIVSPLQATGSETPLASIGAFSTIIGAGIAAVTQLYLNRREKKAMLRQGR
jgi:hypothetical protein